MNRFTIAVAIGLCCPMAGLATTDVANVIRAAGGTDFSVRAGQAVRATCQDLGAQNALAQMGMGTPLTNEEGDLFGRCADMSTTVLAVFGTGTQNRYNANEVETYAILRQFSGEEA